MMTMAIVVKLSQIINTSITVGVSRRLHHLQSDGRVVIDLQLYKDIKRDTYNNASDIIVM